MKCPYLRGYVELNHPRSRARGPEEHEPEKVKGNTVSYEYGGENL
jgi:hypothetical protein